jgi:hypothetical protein
MFKAVCSTCKYADPDSMGYDYFISSSGSSASLHESCYPVIIREVSLVSFTYFQLFIPETCNIK